MTPTAISQTPSPTPGFLRLPDVLKIIPVSRSTWWAGVKSGRYPQPIKISHRCTAWRREDIMALVCSLNSDQ